MGFGEEERCIKFKLIMNFNIILSENILKSFGSIFGGVKIIDREEFTS